MNTVTNVAIATGVSAQTGKPWTRYDATLDNGVVASGFEFVKIGDVVDIVQKGEFINYKKIGQTVGNRPPVFNQPLTKQNLDKAYAPMTREDYWRNKEQRDIDKQPRSERQHAQEMAIRTATLLVTCGLTVSPEELLKKIRELINWYQRDISRSPEKVQPESELAFKDSDAVRAQGEGQLPITEEVY